MPLRPRPPLNRYCYKLNKIVGRVVVQVVGVGGGSAVFSLYWF